MEESVCVPAKTLNSNECFIKRKQKNIEKKLNFDIQWVINCFFMIVLLSVWDMSDVYQYFRTPMKSGMNMLMHKNSSYQHFLSQLDTLNENFSLDKISSMNEYTNIKLADMKLEPGFNGKINVMSDYYNKYDGSFYQHFFSHHNDQQYEKKNFDSSIDKQFKTTTQIKALCIFKIHSQVLGDALILIFTLIIIVKLRSVELFIKWNSREYLGYFREKQEKCRIITL